MGTGAIWLGGERNIKGKKQELSGVWSLRIHGDRISPVRSEDLVEMKGLSSGWLLGFSDLQLDPQHLSLGFYYSSYISPLRVGGNEHYGS